MTTTRGTFTVLPAAVTFEGIALSDGRVIAVELAQPRQRFAIVHQQEGEVEIIAMRDSEGEAAEECRRLIAQMELLCGVTLQ